MQRCGWPVLLPRAVVAPGPELPRARSRSVTLPYPGSVPMSMAPVIIDGHEDAQHLGCHLRLCWYLRAMPSLGTYWSEGPLPSTGSMVTSGRELLPRAVSGPVVMLQVGSVLISVACSSTGAMWVMCIEIQVPCWECPALCWPWEIWPSPLLAAAAGVLAPPLMRELAPHLTTGMGQLTVMV